MILLVIMQNSSYDAMRGCLEKDLKHCNVFKKECFAWTLGTDFVDSYYFELGVQKEVFLANIHTLVSDGATLPINWAESR